LVTIKSKTEIEKMREAGRVADLAQKAVEAAIKPGVTTLELDRIAEETMRANGGFPAEKGYPSGMKGVPDFPGSICASVNDNIIHGIPSKYTVLKEGDIISVDLVVYKDGYNGDCCRTYKVGKVSNEAQKLIDVTRDAFYAGLKMAKKGNRIGDIGNAVCSYVQSFGFDVIREYEGHGIGMEMHEEPGVPNYGKPGHGMKLVPGMTICIEPMVVAGSREICQGDDGWSVWTVDESLTAHYENTILITENEPEILTKS
jgi:methionyl aminopeptidase